MPCTKCSSDFNIFNWKIKCGECDEKYCNKCLKRRDGVLYCEKCQILLKRPPDKSKLMELKSKDIQDYLNKHNISTHGLVEKQELVDLFCKKHIPEKPKRGVEKLTANFAGSLPNLRPLNEFIGNLESVITNNDLSGSRPNRTTTTQPQHQSPPSRSPSSNANSSSSNNNSPTSKPQSPTATTGETSGSTSQNNNNNNNDNSQQATTSSTNTNIQEIPTQKEEQINETFQSPPPKYPKLEDFSNADELHSLSAKDLKILLTLNRVDFKGCVEKSELLERAKRLWEDNNEQRKENPEVLPVQDLCKLCMDAPLDCVLLECGHIATCTDCGKKLAECPICRQYVVRVVRTFRA